MSASRFCVVYVRQGIEQQTAWFASRERALLALAIVRRRHPAILYRD